MIINSLEELKQIYFEHDIGEHFNQLEFEMIGDDSGFECAVIYTDSWDYPHECYVYTKDYCYSIEHLAKIQDDKTILFDTVIVIPRYPDKE